MYTLKYPNRVEKLILWSPYGTEPKIENYEEELEKRMKKAEDLDDYLIQRA